ncbi:dihydropteroate synthase [Burkholderiales bacterium]|nr:dihydropteroate synthase [Burkholderiales bacterium]
MAEALPANAAERPLRCGRFVFRPCRPLVMGVLNVTPDSFSDGGRYAGFDAALAQAQALIEEGADLLDIGGESTRPGAREVSVEEELRRVLPLVQALARGNLAVSVDTRKPEVMRAAIEAGAAMINDVFALRAEGALEALAASDAAICLMHMQGEPDTMQRSPQYHEVAAEVRDFLHQRAATCVAAGVAKERIVLDPGFGFGKTLEHNLALLQNLGDLGRGEFAVLAGLSRKSMLGSITGRPVAERLAASLAAALAATAKGAAILRVHDVAATVDALKVWRAAQGLAIWPQVASG